MSGVKEVTHGPQLHAVEGVAVQAIAEAGAGAIADRDPCLNLLGEVAVTATIGDQGVLVTAGAPCVLPRHLQRKRSAALHLIEAGARVAAPRIR